MPFQKLQPVSRELVTNLTWSWAVPITWWIKSTIFTLFKSIHKQQKHLNLSTGTSEPAVGWSALTPRPHAQSESSTFPEQLPFLTTSSLPSFCPLAPPSKDVTLMKKAWSFSFFSFSMPAYTSAHKRAAQLTELQWHSRPTVWGHMAVWEKDVPDKGTTGGKGRTANTFETITITLFFWPYRQLHMRSPIMPPWLYTAQRVQGSCVDNCSFCSWLTNLMQAAFLPTGSCSLWVHHSSIPKSYWVPSPTS